MTEHLGCGCPNCRRDAKVLEYLPYTEQGKNLTRSELDIAREIAISYQQDWMTMNRALADARAIIDAVVHVLNAPCTTHEMLEARIRDVVGGQPPAEGMEA